MTDLNASSKSRRSLEVYYLARCSSRTLASAINVVENGHLVSRRSDFIIYSVEAEYVDDVVRTYGPCRAPPITDICLSEATKVGAIIGGQTSCKAPEIAAFEKYLPDDVEILPVHSLHGPNVDPRGQPLVSISLITHSYIRY